MPLDAGEQPAFSQGGHQLTDVCGVGMDALGDFIAGEVGSGMQSEKSQDVDGVAELGGVFQGSIPPSSWVLI